MSMNIDMECIGLLSLILQDSPKDRQFILCVLARSNSDVARITFNPNTDYPTFYGYSNSRIPIYLMRKGVLSNVPREGKAKRLISSHYLSYAETIINGVKNWDLSQKLMSVSKFITLDNETVYKDAEVFLVFRDKAADYIKGYATSHEEDSSAVPSHEYFLTNSDLVESLQRKVNTFINLSERGFFLGIADYVKFIDENSGFEPIIKTIDGFRERDRVKISELEEKLLEDIGSVDKIVMGRIKSEKIDSGIIGERIKEYEMTKDGRLQSSDSKVEALHGSLAHVIMSLHETGYEALAADFVQLVPDSKSIADYKISEYYYPYREELQEYRSKVQKTIWGSWNELVVVYLVVHKYREHMAELKIKNDGIGEMNFHLLYKEMENILGNSKDEQRRLQFVKDDYVSHINRVHDFFINKLNSEPNKNAEEAREKTSILKERYSDLLKEIKGDDGVSSLGERYQKVVGEIKSQGSDDAVKEKDDITLIKNRPFCTTEGKMGYLKFGKHGQKIKIGGIGSRHFRLLQCLLEPLGIAKTVDAVFEAIRLTKDKADTRLQDQYMSNKRKAELIVFAIKELQKGSKLKGKLIFEFDETKAKVWLKFLA